MRPSEALHRHRADIRRIVLAHHGSNPRVFGSVVRGEDGDGSDLDILVDKTPRMSLRDLARIETEIEEVAGVRADVMTSFFKSPKVRDAILAEAQPV